MNAFRADRLDSMLQHAAARYADRPAIASPGRRVTYSEFITGAQEFRLRLAEAGCRAGDEVLLAVDNRADDLVWQTAIWLAGAVAVPLSRTAPPMVLRRTAERTGARLLAGGDTPASWHDVLTEDATSPDLRIVAGRRSAAPAELDRHQALVIFTSGSTGEPKGVVLSHSALARKLGAIQKVLPFAPDSVTLQVLHLHFSFGQWTSMLTLATGGLLDLRQRFSVSELLHDLTRERVDRIAVVPSMLRMLIRKVEASADPEDPPRLAAPRSPALWISGGEPLPAALGRRVRALFPSSGVADVFGLSESATSDLILTPQRYDREAGTLGRPSPGVRVRVVDADGADCAPGEPGELWLLTEYLMTGYLGDPEATAATLADGWLRTGDRARRRPDGLLELAGRSKDLIVRGGSKISPLEVENAYGEHPDCAGCVVVGVADEVVGERVHLLMMPGTGRTVDPQEALDWGRERLDRHKVPDRLHLVAELPLGRTGKLDRGLARTVAAKLAAGRHDGAGDA